VPDRVCDVCKRPKPEIAFDHAEARQGSRKTTCQPCLRDIRKATRHRATLRRAAKGKAARIAAGLPHRGMAYIAERWARS